MALSILLVFVLLVSDRLKTLASLALVLLLAGDLALNHGNLYSPAPASEFFEKDLGVRFLERNRGDAYSRIAVYNTAHTNYFGLFGFELANGHHPFPSARYASFLPLLRNPDVASLAGVEHNVIYARGEDGRPYDPPVKHSEDVSITPLPLAPLPRAFLVRNYRVSPATEILDAMRKRRFDPSMEVILEEAPAGLALPVNLPAEGSATITSRKANEVTIETVSEHETILVLSESYYPGWRAEVDGARKEVMRANYVFRALPLSEGKHTVVFKFKPTSFFLGVAISCAGIIAWLSWALFLYIGRRS